MARREGDNVKMDMTPMIDCVFLLIIFFVIVTQVVSDRVPLTPPSAEHASEDKLPAGFCTINVDYQGRVYVGGKMSDTWADFETYLKQRKNNHGDAFGFEDHNGQQLSKMDLYIRGDHTAHWVLIQEVLAIAQSMGIYRTEYGSIIPLKKKEG